MKICKICMANDILCSACSKKVEKGEIRGDDVKISRYLNSKGMDFIRSFESDGKVYIIVEEAEMGNIIGKSGKNVKGLGKILGKEIKILQKEEPKSMMEKTLDAPVVGINKIYGQNEFYRIRIDKRARKKLRKGFEKVIESILESRAEIVFE
ncbi:MAG: KH domain-containing protein [Candidatus Aenigmarchaeota archaeon]|nr:KH domain-containing protein [Candidatus Aenigmarchaeota archaeon]MDI6722250.1 KH domain-containing protein [Candidatus Aenigmarchaeota archaeon]